MPYIGNPISDFNVSTAMLNTDSVTSIKIDDGTIVNADINDSAAIAMSKLALSITNSEVNASAAIAGTKISPNFGPQTVTASNLTLSDNDPIIQFTDANNDPDYRILVESGIWRVQDTTNGNANRLQINADGHIDIAGNLDVGAGLDVTGAITGTGDMTIDTNTLKVDSSNNRVGIGTTSPATRFAVKSAGANSNQITLVDHDSTNEVFRVGQQSDGDGFLQLVQDEGTVGVSFDASGVSHISGGNVGIGGTPSALLHVQGNPAEVRIQHAGNGGFSRLITDSSNNLGFYVGGGPALAATLDASGRLLIGHTSTQFSMKLSVAGTDGGGSSCSLSRFSNNTSPSTLLLSKSRGTSVGSYTVVQDDDQVGSIDFRGADGTDNNSKVAEIIASIDGTPGSNDMPGRLQFHTTADGASSTTERMRIDSSGKVGIGTTSPAGKLDIGGLTNTGGENVDALKITRTDGLQLYGINWDVSANEVSFSGNTKNYVFKNGSSSAETMRIEAGGDIGINTTNPGSRLAIYDADGDNLLLASHNYSGETRIGFTGNTGTGGTNVDGGTTGAIGVTGSAPGGAATGYMSLYTNYGDSLQERARLTAYGRPYFNSGKNNNFANMAPNLRGNLTSFESTTGVDSNLYSGVIHHQIVSRGTSERTDSLFSFKGSGNCGFFAEVTAYFSAATVGTYQGRQRMWFRAARNSNNDFQITQAHNYDKVGTSTTTHFNPVWGSSGSGTSQILTVKVTTTAMTNYIQIMYVTKFISMDSIHTFTTLL